MTSHVGGHTGLKLAIVVVAAALALAGCQKKPVAAATPATPGVQAEPTVAELQAKAAAAEADAQRLEAQANGQAAALAPPAPSAPAADPLAGAHTLGPGAEKLNSGQYYVALNFPAKAGEIYDLIYTAHGYLPVIVVLDNNKKPFTQSTAAGPGPDYTLDDRIQPDAAGTWYVLLSAANVGAGGTYQVNLQKVTQ